MDIHAGDILTFRQWDDMKSEFGVNANGDINTSPFIFTRSMRQFCGTKIHVKNIFSDGLIISREEVEGGWVDLGAGKFFVCNWKFCPNMFEDESSYDPISTEELARFLNS